MKNQASIEIDRRIDEVFQLTTEHVADWSKIVVEDTMIHQTKDFVGSTFRTVTEDRGRRMEFEGVVTKHDPPHLHAVKLAGKSFTIKTEYRFEHLGSSTRVTQSTNVTGKGFFKLMLFLMGFLMSKAHCDATYKELQNLKAFCETSA